MKKFLKKIQKLINEKSITMFCKYHFRNQAKKYCRENNIKTIEKKYSKDIKKYWKKYEKNTTTIFHKWYTGSNGIKDVRYIPEDFFYDKIERYYNDIDLEMAYSDKGMYKRLLPNIPQPETIILNMNGIFYDNNYNIITLDKAIELVSRIERYVIKPTRDSGGGKNVQFINNIEKEKNNIKNIFHEYKKNFIIQKPLKQHKKIEEIHKESINTIRVMSMLENGNVSIISSVLRMGVGDSCVDNECSGGINCGINEDGTLSKNAYDGSGKIYLKHPQGYEFEKGNIPAYSKIISLIKKEHTNMPYFGLISWDFTVDQEENPVMIELNLRWCGLNFHQLHHGPLFGDRTTEILNKVTNK